MTLVVNVVFPYRQVDLYFLFWLVSTRISGIFDVRKGVSMRGTCFVLLITLPPQRHVHTNTETYAYTKTYKHTHTYIHKYIHRHSHWYTDSYTHRNTLKHTHIYKHAHIHRHIEKQSHIHRHTHKQTHINKYAHIHKHIQKQTHIHRYTWCNGYRCRKWTRWHEFKSWKKLIAFHIALIPLGKVWIQLFSLQLWVNSRAD